MSKELFDITIIGGGPVGLFASFYSGLRAMKTKIIEAEPDVGGKVRYFYPEKLIHDIGGIPEIRGSDFVNGLKEQAETFEPEICYNTKVIDLKRLADGTFELTDNTGTTHYSRTVLIAVGSGTYIVNQLEAENADSFETAIHYHVRDLEAFRGQEVIVSGGGDAAMDWARMLEDIAAKVHLVYRGEDFRGHERRVQELRASNVNVLVQHEIQSLYGENGHLEGVTLFCKQTSTSFQLPAATVFVNHGVKIDIGTMHDWGFQTEEYGIVVDETMATTVPGIYACGDVAIYPRKIRIIAAGFHEGPIAVNSAKRFLEPDAANEAMVSTHHEKFMHLS